MSWISGPCDPNEPPLIVDAPRPKGNALLRALAEASDGRLVEVEDGVWIESRLEPPVGDASAEE